MSDNIALISFFEGWEQSGTGKDGMPLFREVVKIRKSVPPLTQVEYLATEADFEEFPLQYQLFRKQQGARRPEVEGYPLALWPVISPADFQNCAAREIYTVEQLAKLATSKDVPPPIVELAKRAKKLVELQASTGKFEVIISELTAERDALAAELKDANATISALNAQISVLRPARAA